MSEVLRKQVDALLVQLEVARVMALGIQQALNQPRAEPAPLPDRCKGEQEEFCALRNPEAAVEMGGMGGSAVTVMCRGCGEQRTR